MPTTRRRIARKTHRCGSCTKWNIEPGHVYLAHTIFPSDDISGLDTPQRSKECAECAIRYGRSWDLEPIPRDHPSPYWLADGQPDYCNRGPCSDLLGHAGRCSI